LALIVTRIKKILAIEILLLLMYINLPKPSFYYYQEDLARLKLFFMLVFAKPTIKPKKHGLEISKY